MHGSPISRLTWSKRRTAALAPCFGLILGLASGVASLPAAAQREMTVRATEAVGWLERIAPRASVSVPVWVMPSTEAFATAVLLPGGAGGLGMRGGEPSSRNFLIRSREPFAAQGLNVAAGGMLSDKTELDYVFRSGAEHAEDLRRIVLTSGIAAHRITGAVPTQPLDRIRVSALVVHPERDACPFCRPHEVPLFLRGPTQAPVKKLLLVDGSGPPDGDPCEALRGHGFIDIEAETVRCITDGMRAPHSSFFYLEPKQS